LSSVSLSAARRAQVGLVAGYLRELRRDLRGERT